MRVVHICTIPLKLGIKIKLTLGSSLGLILHLDQAFSSTLSLHSFSIPAPTGFYWGWFPPTPRQHIPTRGWYSDHVCTEVVWLLLWEAVNNSFLRVLRRTVSLPLCITQWPESKGFTLIHNRDYLHSTFSVEDLTVNRKGASTSYALTYESWCLIEKV